jgi:predicted PurR-regulated permease PerM
MKKEQNYWWILVILLAVVGLVYVFRKILLYMVLAAVVGFVGDPLVDQFEKIKYRQWQMPRWVGAILTLAIMIGLLTGIIALFYPLIQSEIAMIQQIDIEHIEQNLAVHFPQQIQWLNDSGIQTEAYLQLLKETQQRLSISYFSAYFTDALSWIFAVVGGFISVLFMSFFFLKDEELFYKILLSVTPDQHVDKMKNIVIHTKKALSRYFGGLIIQIILMTIMIGIGLSVAHVPNAWLIAIFSGLMNVIPYMGPLISFGFALLIGISSSLSAEMGQDMGGLVVGITMVYVIAQSIDAFLVQPLILGGSIRVHPLELFIVLMAAATVGGIPAMAVALPVYTILRIAAREWLIEFKWVKQLTQNM